MRHTVSAAGEHFHGTHIPIKSRMNRLLIPMFLSIGFSIEVYECKPPKMKYFT